MWRDQFYVDGISLRIDAFDGGRGDNAGKIERRMTQIEITAEDYTAVLKKLLQDTLENPESRARLVQVAENLQKAAQTFAERYRLFLQKLDERLWPRESGEQSVFWLAKISDGYASFVKWARQFVDAIESAPPSKGYEPLFIGHGDEHLTARFLALVIVTVGPKYADENNRQRPAIATAIRNLGKKGTRRTRSVVRACETILSMPVAHSLIDCIFMEAGHRDLSNEFANLLERAVAADPEACRRLIEIARTVADDIPPPRGKKISLATAMHQLLLEMLRSRQEETAYTWNDDQEDFVDAVTQATRREVGDPDFDPRPARRRMRARQRRTTGNQLARRERRPAARKPSRI